jgi:hypothetical protein
MTIPPGMLNPIFGLDSIIQNTVALSIQPMGSQGMPGEGESYN